MEFWGIEVKPGSSLKVEPEDGYLIHISQVSLGDLKKVKEDENVPVYVSVGDDKHKHVIGNLSKKIPQVSLDLFFEQEFELSHDSKTCVFFLGNKTPNVMDEQEEEVDSDFDSDEEGIPMEFLHRGKLNDQIDDESDDSDEEDESDSEMGSDEEEEEEVMEEASLMVGPPPSKKIPNGGAMKNAKVAIPHKSSGGKKVHKCCKH